MMREWRSNLQQKVFITSLLLWPCLVVTGGSRACVVGICDGSVAKVEVRNNIHLFAKSSGAVTVCMSRIPMALPTLILFPSRRGLLITVSSHFVESRSIRMWMP